MWDKPALLNAIASVCIACAVLLALTMAAHYTARLPAFELRGVRVEGSIAHVTREQIEAIVKHELSGTFFTVSLTRMRAAFEKLPWVRSASARRQWPNRLVVTLEEHVPLARWGTTGLVDAQGAVFTAAYDGTLPLFEGPEGSAKELVIQYGYFQRALAAIGQSPTEVRVSERRAWRVRLASGTELQLGRTNIEQRLDRFIALYERTLKPLHRRIEYVDLRYPNGFAVRIPELNSAARGLTKRG